MTQNSTSWKKGESGNPGGKPGKGHSFRDLVEELFQEDIELTDKNTGKKVRVSKKRALVHAAFQYAMAGSAPHLRELWDRYYGKVEFESAQSKLEEITDLSDGQYQTLLLQWKASEDDFIFDREGNLIKPEEKKDEQKSEAINKK